MTGLSGAGKSTLAAALAKEIAADWPVEVLDGDEVRTHLSRGLGFSKEDRDTNIRRIAWVARTLARNGVAVIAAAISPYRGARAEARAMARESGVPFVEVFVRAPLATLLARDVKGLYKKALAGELTSFTGVSDPYEPPEAPEVTVDSSVETLEESVAAILSHLREAGLLDAAGADETAATA